MRTLLMFTLLLTLAASSVLAAVPTTMNYQALLNDNAGDPVADASYSVVFTIYDDAVAGASVWTETQNVTTTGGLFAVLLGSVNPVEDTVFNGTTRFLGVKVAADPELTPRTAMVSVPYSQRVSTVDGASGGTITSKLSIGSGHTNTGFRAFVAGDSNTVSGDMSTIGGGYGNTASGFQSTVGGGYINEASGALSTVSSGNSNLANGDYSTIGGGSGNTASDWYATVGGGKSITASGNSSTVGGGSVNTAIGTFSTIGGGWNNTANGSFSTVPGGSVNTASGNDSFAAGHKAKANHNGSFVWADATDADFASTGNNQFLIRAAGGVGINTNSPNGYTLNVNGSAKFYPGDGSFGDIAISTPTGSAGFIAHSPNGNRRDIRFRDIGIHLSASNVDGGNFDYVGINITESNNVGIGTNTPNYMLDVRGTIGNNATLHHSDRRWKDNISTLSNSLDKVQQLRGVSFDWKRDEFEEMNFPEGKQIGLIAQEVEEVLPELVNTAKDGYKSVDYSKLIAVLIEANKEQQTKIDALESKLAEIDELKALVQQLASQNKANSSTYGLK